MQQLSLPDAFSYFIHESGLYQEDIYPVHIINSYGFVCLYTCPYYFGCDIVINVYNSFDHILDNINNNQLHVHSFPVNLLFFLMPLIKTSPKFRLDIFDSFLYVYFPQKLSP